MKIFPHGTTVENHQNLSRPDGCGVGIRTPKLDALSKLFGRTPYTDDIKLPNMVYGKIVRCPHAHARIISIDKESVKKIDGVLDVIVGQDMATKYGVIPWTKDEYPLAVDKARFVGDGVAAVIAETEEIAHRAAAQLAIGYEVMPPILTIADAKAITSIQVNEHAKIGNITKEVDLSFGDVDKELANADIVVTENFSFHGTSHTPIEPHAAIGDFSPSGLLTVYSATQVPHYLHRTLAEVLDIPAHHIRVMQPPVGGAFGGKSEPFDLEFVVAIASRRLKRPVKILYTREEVFYAHRGRHPMDMCMTMGVKNDGTIMALRNLIDIDGGAYASFGMITAFYAGQLLTGPVGMKSYHFRATRYYTNKPACGPKRGHGSVQPRFAFEILCDIMAEKVKLDPIEFRKKNALKAGDTTVNGQQIGSLGLIEALDRVAAASRWYERRRNLPFGRGLGVASSMYISGTNYPVYPNDMPQSSVTIRLDRSGRVILLTGAADIGQGSNAVLSQIAMEELGISLDRIQVISGDSDLCPIDLGSYSSRVTLMMGLAAQEALKKARHILTRATAIFFAKDNHWQKMIPQISDENDFLFFNDRIHHPKFPEASIDFRKAVELAETMHGSLVFSGDFRTVERGGKYRGGTIGASPAYSCTAHVADVSVDIETGRFAINKIYVAHDCGRAINPSLVEGQMEGSTYMGAAEVVLEHFLTDEEEGGRKGLLIAPNLLDYRIPTSLDAPDIEAFIVEHHDQNGPYGAKEAGEGPLHSAIPAIANAIYHAVSVRLFSLPFSPEKILSELQKQQHRSKN
jgi:4-hydroxybenzoyl-CoA reductase alpha subunit